MNLVMSASISTIAPAILAAKKEMGNAIKDATNPFFKSSYADLNAVREAAEPALMKHGIAVLQPMVQKDGKSYIRTMLLHSSGEYITSDTEVVCSKQNDPQSYGSAVSYARRYGLQAFVSLGASDDDGEAAMGRTKALQTKEEAPKVTTSFRKPNASTTTTLKAVTPTSTTVTQINQTNETTEGWT